MKTKWTIYKVLDHTNELSPYHGFRSGDWGEVGYERPLAGNRTETVVAHADSEIEARTMATKLDKDL